jgi:hypothetical protein
MSPLRALRARGALALAALGFAAACVPFDPIDEPDTLAPGESHLVVDTTVGAVKVYAYDGPLPPLVASSARLDATFVLAYDRPRAELELVLDEDRVVLAAADEAGDPLPPPRVVQRWDRAQRALVEVAPGSWPEALADVRVAHAQPCPALRTVPVRYDARRDSQALFSLGDAVLVGQGPDIDGTPRMIIKSPRIFRVDDGATVATEVAAPSVLTGTAVAFAGLHYRDATGVRLLWGVPSATVGYGAISYARTLEGSYEDPRPMLGVPGEPAIVPAAVASGVFDGRATVVMADYMNALVSFDEDRGVWRRGEVVTASVAMCSVGTHTQVLEVTGPGQGWVSLVGGIIRSFDVRSGPALGEPLVTGSMKTCRAAYARLSDGSEVVAWQESPVVAPFVRSLLWRRSPGSEWRRIATQTAVSGADLEVRDDVLYATAGGGDVGGDMIAVFVYDPRRPDLPPRHCQDIPTRVSPLSLVRTDRGILIGGSDGGLEWLLGD